jgi:hypothetical protein
MVIFTVCGGGAGGAAAACAKALPHAKTAMAAALVAVASLWKLIVMTTPCLARQPTAALRYGRSLSQFLDDE